MSVSPIFYCLCVFLPPAKPHGQQVVRGVRDDDEEGGDPRKSSSTIRILSFPDQHVVRGVRDDDDEEGGDPR